ncbi:MAG TPA: hypothetical protein VF364_01895 [Candidatus Limnocylindria bacterium]
MPTNPRRAFALACVALAAALAPLVSAVAPAGAVAGPSGSTPNAMALVRAMSDDGVPLTQRRHEGPGAVVNDGLCSFLAEGGCTEGVITKDASLLLFDTAQNAGYYTGCGDDQASRLGRVVVSFGNPARMGQARQERYVDAVRRYRANHPGAKADLERITQALMRRGLPMRNAHADEGETRPGLATGIPGAVDMAATKQVDVIVFGIVKAAEDYAGAADDQVYRRGRVVLSFGNPALLGEERQARFAAALRRAIASTGQTFSAVRTAAAGVVPTGIKGCGG